MQRYVLGFACTHDKKVVLIKKNRPHFLSGKWNGVGGKVEDNEMYVEAMVREFREETGMGTSESDWNKFTILTDDKNYEIACFYSTFHQDQLFVNTTTDEEIKIWSINEVVRESYLYCSFDNELSWLINLAWRNIIASGCIVSCRALVKYF